MLILVLSANVLVFLVMAATTDAFSWDAQTLFAWGGNFGAATLHGQPWRVLSAQFLHVGVQHIVGNMILLAITGPIVEARLGPWRALAAYLACGAAGWLLSSAVYPEVVGVGASGAIAGLLGLVVVLYASGAAPEIRGAWIAQTVGINALYSFAPNVDWAAHAGGFCAGLAAGGILLAVGLPGGERA